MSEKSGPCPACNGSRLVPSGRAVCGACGGSGEKREIDKRLFDAILAGCAPPWVGNDEDAVRFRHNERQADREEREEYDTDNSRRADAARTRQCAGG